MSLELKINEALKNAMREKNKTALESIRAIKSALLVLKTDGKTENISEEQEIAILQRLVKQRKEAADQFFANDRKELGENELAQSKIIEHFLPEQINAEEIKTALQAIILELEAKDIKDLGKVMALATKEFLGKADGKTVSEIARKLLN